MTRLSLFVALSAAGILMTGVLGGAELAYAETFVLGEEDGFRPLHISIYDRYAAILTGKAGAKSRIYLYDIQAKDLKLIGEDGKTGIQIIWGHLHYKSGQVSINDKYVAYCRENGDRDQLILRDISNPDKATVYDMPDGTSCGQVSVGNSDTKGFGIMGFKNVLNKAPAKGETFHANVYYFDIAERKIKLIHASACDSSADPENSWLYNRGVQTRNGRMTWLFGSHDCVKATAYYWNGTYHSDGTAVTRALPLSLHEKANVQNPVMVLMHDGKVYLHTHNIRYRKRQAGIAVWDPDEGTLTHLGGGLTPSVSGKWLLFSNPDGIHRIDVSAEKPWETKTLLVRSEYQGSYASSGARLSSTGKFIYFKMDKSDGTDTRVYMSDIETEAAPEKPTGENVPL